MGRQEKRKKKGAKQNKGAPKNRRKEGNEGTKEEGDSKGEFDRRLIAKEKE